MAIATKAAEVRYNIHSFAKVISSPKIVATLGYQRVWCTIGKETKREFAPAKWAAYSGLTVDEYAAADDGIDPRYTLAVLEKWSVVIRDTSATHADLLSQLATFMNGVRKRPSRAAFFLVL